VLDWAGLSPASSARWFGLASGVLESRPGLAAAILGHLTVMGDSDARDLLIEQTARGRTRASAWAVSLELDLGRDKARTLVRLLDQTARKTVSEARNHTFSFGRGAVWPCLVWINTRYSEIAEWDGIFAALDEPAVDIADKSAICESLAFYASRVTDDVRGELGRILPGVRGESPSMFGDPDELLGMVLLVRAKLDLIEEGELAGVTLDLLLSRDGDRARHALEIVSEVPSLGPRIGDVALGFVGHADPYVRVGAARVVAGRVLAGAGETFERCLIRALTDPGAIVPARTLQALHGGDLPDRIEEQVTVLAGHTSSAVRRSAAQVLSRGASG
jgi:hypothetical protein